MRATEGEIDIVENALATHSNVVRFIENKGEIVGFALSQTFVYWGFDREKGSISFTRFTHTSFAQNGLQLR